MKKPPSAPNPTDAQRETLISMHADRRSQVAIAGELGVPRSRVRIWFQRLDIKAAPKWRSARMMWAIVNPSGYVVSRHGSEMRAHRALYPLRQFGCEIRQMGV